MTYQAKDKLDSLTWQGENLDIVTGHDEETGKFVCDIVYHGTDVGVMGVHETGFEHIKAVLTPVQFELLMEDYAQAYVLGYDQAIKDIKEEKK